MTVWIQNPFDNLPPEGRRKQRFWLMAEAFAKAGHRVTLWTSDFSHATKRPRKLTEGPLPTQFMLRLIPTRPYRRNVSIARIVSHRAYAQTWERMAQERSERPDVIIASMPTIAGAEAALRIGRAKGARVVIDVMDAWPETFERLVPSPFRILAKWLLEPLARRARRVYRSADLVTGVCDRYRALTGRADYHLAYHGVEI